MAPPRRVVAMAGSHGALQVMFHQVRQLTRPDSSCLFLLYHRTDAPPLEWGRLLPAGSGYTATPLQDGRSVETKTIYYTVSGTTFGVSNGIVQAIPGPLHPRPNLDLSLTSLAREFGPRVLGVLLSGGGRDGVAGMRAIRDAGGVTVVQDPDTAPARDLPRKAVEAGVQQALLSPEQIVAEVTKVLRGDESS